MRSPVRAALTATDRFFVNDFANVLSDEAENTMYKQGVQLYEKTKAQVVAVTVDSLDGEQIEDYSYDLANRWGIGEAEKDTGVLLLLAGRRTRGAHRSGQRAGRSADRRQNRPFAGYLCDPLLQKGRLFHRDAKGVWRSC